MMKQVVILGAGTAGTMMANKLVRALPATDWKITVVDRDDVHIYQPGLLFVPFGTYRPEQVVRRRKPLVDASVDCRLTGIDRVAPDEKTVYLQGGEKLRYDILIVATGSRIMPESTPGLTGVGWKDSAFDFYTYEGAVSLARKLERFEGGRLVVNVVEMPIKCPVAPLEFAFLADAFFKEKGMRSGVEITLATPLDGANFVRS